MPLYIAGLCDILNQSLLSAMFFLGIYSLISGLIADSEVTVFVRLTV